MARDGVAGVRRPEADHSGDAANSYLIKKMEGASDIEGDVMPPSGSIDQARANRVRRWIDDL